MDLIKQQNLKDDVDTFIRELSQTQGWSNTPILSLNKHQWDEKFELNNGNARFFRITELSAEEEAILRQDLENVIACLDCPDYCWIYYISGTSEGIELYLGVVNKALQGKYTKVQSKQFCRDRNPVLDIREANVAIDFGTSSTVVAIRKNGKDELLRIGMQEKDFAKDVITDQQYENPTVLEFLDLQNFLNEWQSESYRPLVDWDNIHCSHEARSALRNNNSNTKVVSSIFARLKQWALRNEQTAKVCLRDQQEYEYQLQPLTEYNPVKGQPIQIGKDYPQLDPIEVYAWFFGNDH